MKSRVRLNGKQLKRGFVLNSIHHRMRIKEASIILTISLNEDEYHKTNQLFDNLIGLDNFDIIITQR